MTASRGTAVFQITTMEFDSDMNFAPARFMPVNRAIAAKATIRPRPFRFPAWSSMLKWSVMNLVLLAYSIAARISIGAIATACSHDDQPAKNPVVDPWEKYGNRPVPPATG